MLCRVLQKKRTAKYFFAVCIKKHTANHDFAVCFSFAFFFSTLDKTHVCLVPVNLHTANRGAHGKSQVSGCEMEWQGKKWIHLLHEPDSANLLDKVSRFPCWMGTKTRQIYLGHRNSQPIYVTVYVYKEIDISLLLFPSMYINMYVLFYLYILCFLNILSLPEQCK